MGMRRAQSATARGFVWAELAALTAVVAVVGVLALPVMHRARLAAGEKVCAGNVRTLLVGLQTFAGGNNGQYPTPSILDAENTTLTARSGKDRPSHVLSILMFNRFIAPAHTNCPGEQNPFLQHRYDNYKYVEPFMANFPSQALWDPAFRATTHDPQVYFGTHPAAAETSRVNAHNSYAMTPFPTKGHGGKWRSDGRDTQAVIGDRGPAYNAVGVGMNLQWVLDADASTDSPWWGTTRLGWASYAWRTHGDIRNQRWRGNVGLNDGAVSFADRPEPRGLPYTFTSVSGPGGLRVRTLADNLFVNERTSDRFPPSSASDVSLHSSDQYWNYNTNHLRNWSGGTWYESTARSPARWGQLTFWFD